jgi:CP family cyanate transporter-like MFS transporter
MKGRNKAQSTLLIAAILVVSLNLRPAIATIGPLTNLILTETGMGST